MNAGCLFERLQGLGDHSSRRLARQFRGSKGVRIGGAWVTGYPEPFTDSSGCPGCGERSLGHHPSGGEPNLTRGLARLANATAS